MICGKCKINKNRTCASLFQSSGDGKQFFLCGLIVSNVTILNLYHERITPNPRYKKLTCLRASEQKLQEPIFNQSDLPQSHCLVKPCSRKADFLRFFVELTSLPQSHCLVRVQLTCDFTSLSVTTANLSKIGIDVNSNRIKNYQDGFRQVLKQNENDFGLKKHLFFTYNRDIYQ